MYDALCQHIMGNEAPPAGTRLDKRVQRPREHFYTSLRTEEAPKPGSRSYSGRVPFLARNTRDKMPVASAANHERPKSKKYR